MAFTLATSTPLDRNVDGKYRVLTWRVLGSASYTTGGDNIVPSAVGMAKFAYAAIATPFFNGTNFVLAHIPAVLTDGSLQLRFLWTGSAVSTALVEVTAATNLSAYEGIIRFYGD